MNLQSLRIPLIYGILSGLYYTTAAIVFNGDQGNPDNLAERVVLDINEIFYWFKVHVVYIFSLMGTSILGMFYCYKRSVMSDCKAFVYVFLFSGLAFLILLILSVLA